MSVLVHFTSTTQDAPAGQLQETPYTVIRATRRDNLPGGSTLQGYDVSVDRFLDRSQIDADGVHVPRGYEFDHTAACSTSDR